MVQISLIPVEEFHRIIKTVNDEYHKLALTADMCRANTLATVKRAGSGHLGSSFSAMDIITLLFYSEMNTVDLGFEHPDRDIYFSSKGHDVPGLYAILYSLNILPREQFLKLRRLGGTCGHPDVSIPGIEANSGSLGMGISKAKGMAIARSLKGRGGRIFVMTGDGELQEGQIYEALQTAAHQGVTNLTVIVDHNTVQSDKLVSEISDPGDLESKLRGFGWHVSRCNGHDFAKLDAVFTKFRNISDTPKILIADTIKGCGVSFMEHPRALRDGNGLYLWHSGAPDDRSYQKAHEEITTRINRRLEVLGLSPLVIEPVSMDKKITGRVTDEYVADAFGETLVKLGGKHKNLVVLDADLSADCRLRAFERKYPERFIENGIAEQDMVSTAGGLALEGLLPVVNTFGAFLAARSNEQIYTNICEKTKIIYVCHYTGLIPAGPGSSHQSLRDISLFGAMPDVLIIEPCNALETRLALEYCVEESGQSCVLRLVIGPSPGLIELPAGYQLKKGRGVTLIHGNTAVLFAYGPVMLHEAIGAAEILGQNDFHLKVVNMPWLNRIDRQWLEHTITPCDAIYVLEDHAPIGGLGDWLLNFLVDAQLLGTKRFVKLAVEGYPAWGTPTEVLQYHGLDGASIARKILQHATDV